LYSSTFIIGMMKSWRMRWTEHAACIREIIIAYILIGRLGKNEPFEIILA
jgi:hypothetical protein